MKFWNLLRIFFDSTTALILFNYVPAVHLTSKMTLGPFQTTESIEKNVKPTENFFQCTPNKKSWHPANYDDRLNFEPTKVYPVSIQPQ